MQNQTKLLRILSERGISKLHLAQECRISPSYVYDVTNGKRVAYPRFKREVANYLGMTEEELFGKEDQ